MNDQGVVGVRILDVAKIVVAVAAAVLFTGAASRLLGMLVPETPAAVVEMPLPTAVILVAVSGPIVWALGWSVVRSTTRAGGADRNRRSVGHGLTVFAWLPFLWGVPALAVLGPNERLWSYPGSYLVFVSASALPMVVAAYGWRAVTVAAAAGFLTIVGAAFWVPPPVPDVALTVLAIVGWTAFGVLEYRRSAPERRTREVRRRALEADFSAAQRSAAEKRARDERRRWQDTVRIPAHKGRKGLLIDLDRRRWFVKPAADECDDDTDDPGVEVGRVALEHCCEQETSPLVVMVEVRRAGGQAASTLRALTGIDDSGAVGPSVPEVHRTDAFGDVLCALVRFPEDEDVDGQGGRSVLTYVWRVGAHVSDVRVRAWSRDEERVLATVEDIDALVAGVRFL